MAVAISTVFLVDDFDELRTYFAAGVPPVCVVKGQSTPFDGAGGGLFAPDYDDQSTADNDSTVIVDQRGIRWKRLAP